MVKKPPYLEAEMQALMYPSLLNLLPFLFPKTPLSTALTSATTHTNISMSFQVGSNILL